MVLLPNVATWVLQANPISPLMTIEQEPHTAERQDDRKETVPSISSRILNRTPKTVSPDTILILKDSK
jgi:hypothetical protein